MSHLEAEREVEALPRAAPVGRHIRRRDHFLQLLKEGWLARIGVAIVAIALFLTAFGPYIAPFDTIAATPLPNPNRNITQTLIIIITLLVSSRLPVISSNVVIGKPLNYPMSHLGRTKVILW